MYTIEKLSFNKKVNISIIAMGNNLYVMTWLFLFFQDCIFPLTPCPRLRSPVKCHQGQVVTSFHTKRHQMVTYTLVPLHQLGLMMEYFMIMRHERFFWPIEIINNKARHILINVNYRQMAFWSARWHWSFLGTPWSNENDAKPPEWENPRYLLFCSRM